MKRLSFYLLFFLLSFGLYAQSNEHPKANWFNLDFKSDGVYGISTDKAYQFLKNRKPNTVIVAVIDGGTDVDHEDLKPIIWTNPAEIAGNGKDDDHNGYIDDVHGWNFIGAVQYDNTELIRLINKYRPKYESALNTTPFSATERKEFELYQRLVTDYMSQLEKAVLGMENVSFFKKILGEILAKIRKDKPTLTDFEDYRPANELESQVLKAVKSALKDEPDFIKFTEELEEALKHYDTQVKYHLNTNFDPRNLVGDHYNNTAERVYGNADVKGPDSEHGTHVAGIIAAVRNNGIGIEGVADQVRIMPLRVVPDGDERDKDVANAIRYAVDNGAKIINMSFGKSYSWNKATVDSAVRYAQAKDVLLVHAAGNEGKNTDVAKNYPTRFYTDSTGLAVGTAAAWIEVGASGWKTDDELLADFSNYGKKNVDVFAPGVQLNSTIPGSTYKENSGTSMAAPVVSGLAAILRAYFPKLTALEVKDIIVKSVVKPDQKVKVKSEDGSNSRLAFAELSVSGGIVNAARAIELALKTSH